MIVQSKKTHWLQPDWPAPKHVKAIVSTRSGCLSRDPYSGFNTASHVGDDIDSIEICRRYFQQIFSIRKTPQWLDQVHGTHVVEAQPDGQIRTADAAFTLEPGVVCTLHTADCLPVFFCDQAGAQVALAHAGWRGLADGILENTLAAFSCSPQNILCWLGPAISQAQFEVGCEVKACFEQQQSIPPGVFIPSGRVSEAGEHYLCDLYALARLRLQGCGVQHIFGGGFCTYSDTRFFSYRRQPQTGRMLSAVWIQPSF